MTKNRIKPDDIMFVSNKYSDKYTMYLWDMTDSYNYKSYKASEHLFRFRTILFEQTNRLNDLMVGGYQIGKSIFSYIQLKEMFHNICLENGLDYFLNTNKSKQWYRETRFIENLARTFSSPLPDKKGSLGYMYPCGGHAVRIAQGYEYKFAGYKAEDNKIGVIGGCVQKGLTHSLSITFNASIYRGSMLDHFDSQTHEPVLKKPIYVSCSGGPATIITYVDELERTDETVELTAWAWKDGISGGSRGEYYRYTAPVWFWYPEESSQS